MGHGEGCKQVDVGTHELVSEGAGPREWQGGTSGPFTHLRGAVGTALARN